MLLRGAIWLARVAVYLGLFVGAGGAFFVAWMRAPSAPAMRVIGNVIDLVALGSFGNWVGLQGLDALALPPSSLSDPEVWTVGAHGSFGLSVVIAAAALLLALLSHRVGETCARVMSLGALVGRRIGAGDDRSCCHGFAAMAHRARGVCARHCSGILGRVAGSARAGDARASPGRD